MTRFLVNETLVHTTVPAGTVLLDVVRRELGLMGTKEGCREGDCGACGVLVGDRVGDGMRYTTAASCLLPVGDVHGKHVVTIEGLNGDELSPVQQVIVDEGATQCGFCTPGIVIALTGFLLNGETYSFEDAVAAIEGNICRCTGYTAIQRACRRLATYPDLFDRAGRRVESLVRARVLPEYFLDVESRLDTIEPASARGTADPVLVGGGTDLFVQRADQLCREELEFLSRRSDLHGIRQESDQVIVGSATTTEELKQSAVLDEAIPGWTRAFGLVSSTLIRNRATVGGNLVNASPIGDLSVILLALGCAVSVRGEDVRVIPLSRFFLGYKRVDLCPGEHITSVRIPVPPRGSRFNFEKVSRREHLDIASVNSAMLITDSDGMIGSLGLSAGGVAPVPLFLSQAVAHLRGRTVSRDTVEAALRVVAREISPISDVRGSAEYKSRLLRRLIVAHFVRCFPDRDAGDLS